MDSRRKANRRGGHGEQRRSSPLTLSRFRVLARVPFPFFSFSFKPGLGLTQSPPVFFFFLSFDIPPPFTIHTPQHIFYYYYYFTSLLLI